VPVVLRTDIQGIKLLNRGKVRDIYDLGDHLLLVSTDRISAFDYVLPNGIPDKGRVLTGLSVFWFEMLAAVIPNHLVSIDMKDFPGSLQGREELAGRSMLVRRADMFPVECVVRGYLAGSGYKEYTKTGSTSGVKLPPGLKMADRLPELIFTPATKAETGHDENISFETMVDIVGRTTAGSLRDYSLEIFRRGSAHAESRGIIIADTKFEFGVVDGRIVLADEVLTPDSSRFWDASTYRPGESPASFDKQFVRDYLESIDWNKKPPVPGLPEEIVEGTAKRYREIHERLAARPLPG